MPIEPLSITAAVIGITRLTYDSCKALNETIKAIKSAPQQLKSLEADLETFQNVIKPAETDLARCGEAESELSPEQKASLQALAPVMSHCKAVCDRFSLRLAQLTSHSNQSRTALRDRIRLNFHESDVRLLRENMAQCQRTLSDALGFANLRTAHQTRETFANFASEYALSLGAISGQIRGLEASIEAISLSASANDNIIKTLEEQDQMLKACLKVYEPALKETSSVLGTEIKYALAFDRAKVFTGNIDYHGQESTIRIDRLEARDGAQMITGNVSGDFASAWLAGRG